MRALLCWAGICWLATGCVRRVPETSDWEADAINAASRSAACPTKDLKLETIDRTFREVEGKFGARRMIVVVTGCDKEVILVWTPEVGWLGHPPQALPPRPKVKTGPVFDGKVLKP